MNLVLSGVRTSRTLALSLSRDTCCMTPVAPCYVGYHRPSLLHPRHLRSVSLAQCCTAWGTKKSISNSGVWRCTDQEPNFYSVHRNLFTLQPEILAKLTSKTLFHVTEMRFSKNIIPKLFFQVINWITNEYVICNFQEINSRKIFLATETYFSKNTNVCMWYFLARVYIPLGTKTLPNWFANNLDKAILASNFNRNCRTFSLTYTENT